MKKISLLMASLYLTSLNVFSADIQNAFDTGTITVKGSVYANTCSVSSGSATLAIPTTYAADYTAKGDMSPWGKSGNIIVVCTSNVGMTGIYMTLNGDPEPTDPTLYKVTAGTGKAEGVALKVFATPVVNGETPASFSLVPNTENTTIIPNRVTISPQFSWNFTAQTVSVADKVTAGDLATNLTWTARYN